MPRDTVRRPLPHTRRLWRGGQAMPFSCAARRVPRAGRGGRRKGEAMKGRGALQGGADAYELAAGTAIEPEFKQRALLKAGEMYDAMQKRDAALEKYKAVIAGNSGTESAELARHYMKQAYVIQ